MTDNNNYDELSVRDILRFDADERAEFYEYLEHKALESDSADVRKPLVPKERDRH